MEISDVSLSIKKIYDNFLENLYLTIYFQVKNKNDALAIIQHGVEQVLLFDINCEGISTLKERLFNCIFSQVDECLKTPQNYSNYETLIISIPEEIYLYNFNLYQFLNVQDNLLFINTFLKKNEISTEKIKRCNEIITLMRKIYVNRIKANN